MIATLPFAVLGMAHTLRNIRLPAYRAILIALLISPAAAALVQISITRTLSVRGPGGNLDGDWIGTRFWHGSKIRKSGLLILAKAQDPLPFELPQP